MKRNPRILLFHKPKAVVVSRSDEHDRKTVYDMLPRWAWKEGWIPVGRLDRGTRGLLLFVREQELVETLSRPGNLVKTYEVWIRGRVTLNDLQTISSGVASPVGMLRCIRANVVKMLGPKTQLQVTLDEGKNRHIRRMFGALRDPLHRTPLKVLDLKRVQFGTISLDIPSGQWRFLSEKETDELLREDRGPQEPTPVPILE